jgi:hypothetical protein
MESATSSVCLVISSENKNVVFDYPKQSPRFYPHGYITSLNVTSARPELSEKVDLEYSLHFLVVSEVADSVQ